MKNNYANYKNKRFRNKTRLGYKSKGQTDGQKALKLAKVAYKLAKPEFKHFYVGPIVGSYTYAGYLSGSLVTPGQGNGFNERSGNLIYLKELVCIFCMTQAGSNEEFVRLAVVNDKGNKYFNPIDIFEGLGINEAPMTFQTQTHLRNVDIVWDKLFQITNNNPLINYRVTIPVNKYCELSGAASVTSITNAFKIFTCCQSTTSGTEVTFHTYGVYSDS